MQYRILYKHSLNVSSYIRQVCTIIFIYGIHVSELSAFRTTNILISVFLKFLKFGWNPFNSSDQSIRLLSITM